MTADIILTEPLSKHIDRWYKLNQDRRCGVLHGLRTKKSYYALMVAFFDDKQVLGDDIVDFLETNNHVIPSGLTAIGFLASETNDQIEQLQRHMGTRGDLLCEDPVLLKYDPTSVNFSSVAIASDHSERPVRVVSNDSVAEDVAVFHHHAAFESAITPAHSKHGVLRSLELKLVELQMENLSKSAYALGGSGILLLPDKDSHVLAQDLWKKAISSKSTIRNYVAHAEKLMKEGNFAIGPSYPNSVTDITDGLLSKPAHPLRLLRNASASDGPGSSPMLTIGQGETNLVRFEMRAFIFVEKERPLSDLVSLAHAAKRKHMAATAEFLKRSQESEDSSICSPMTFHIGCGPNLLTIVSHRNFWKEDPYLIELQKRFGDPTQAMLFSPYSSLDVRLSMSAKNLLNVGHQLLAKNSPFLRTEPGAWDVSYAPGLYTYHHYKQDRFDDEGWGCAYRSLQTIFSWYKLQGYVARDIPTHNEIQQILVDTKDRNRSLIGSKQWIGALEITRVLEHLLQVQCRIVNVASGRELGTAFAGLKEHFERIGTPVMIGGGVYAYTIVGVAINRTSGEVKAMVVDPHYVGEHDLDLIFKKNGVAWRTPTFWDQNAFYNLCCPLRL